MWAYWSFSIKFLEKVIMRLYKLFHCWMYNMSLKILFSILSNTFDFLGYFKIALNRRKLITS